MTKISNKKYILPGSNIKSEHFYTFWSGIGCVVGLCLAASTMVHKNNWARALALGFTANSVGVLLAAQCMITFDFHLLHRDSVENVDTRDILSGLKNCKIEFVNSSLPALSGKSFKKISLAHFITHVLPGLFAVIYIAWSRGGQGSLDSRYKIVAATLVIVTFCSWLAVPYTSKDNYQFVAHDKVTLLYRHPRWLVWVVGTASTFISIMCS